MKPILNMKRISGLMVLAVLITSCQKAPDTARIGSNGNRSNGLSPGATSTASGIVLNGIVTSDASNQDAFEQEVKDFLAGIIDPSYVGTVSDQGLNQTGVFAGGKVELANGQALPSVGNSRVDISNTSEIFVSVYDRFSDQTNMAPIPPIYLKQSSGYVSGNNVYIQFSDAYGTITLQGTFDASVAVLSFAFNTIRTFDGQTGYSGNLGDLRVPTCQFFRCK